MIQTQDLKKEIIRNLEVKRVVYKSSDRALKTIVTKTRHFDADLVEAAKAELERRCRN